MPVRLLTMRPVYLMVSLSIVVGGLFPAAATAILGPPLALGLLGLGIAHGACDHLLLPAAPAAAAGWGPWWQRGLLLLYVGLAGLVLAAWHWHPGLTIAGFFALSAWHWGSADAAVLHPAPAHAGRWWVLHGLARGLLLFAVPALAWPVETRLLCNDLLAFTHGQVLPEALYGQIVAGLAGAAGLGLTGLWLGYGWLGYRQALLTDVGETALLSLLLLTLPPALASGVYFVAWHSLRHVLRLLPLLPNLPRGAQLSARLRGFWKLALPLLALSVAGLLAVAGWLGPALLARSGTVLALLLLAASVVTLPHAVLVTVVLDRRRWAVRRDLVRRPLQLTP